MTKKKKTLRLNTPNKKKLKDIKKTTNILSYTELICLEYKLKNNL